MSVTCICVMEMLGLFPAVQPYRAGSSLVSKIKHRDTTRRILGNVWNFSFKFNNLLHSSVKIKWR